MTTSYSPLLDYAMPLLGYSSFLALALCAVATWWLCKSKTAGRNWMLWGMMIQGVRLLDLIYQKIKSMNLIVGEQKSHYEFSILLLLVANFGLLFFAIGLYLHAKNQRNLQARVDELERILADMHSRER